MRTLHLIKTLSDTELKEMEQELNDGKRQNLLQLFRYLKKFRSEEKAPAIAEILKKVFAQQHTKPNELQLRNKLSRLNEIICQNLAIAEFKNQIAGNRHLFNQWLTNAYQTRKTPLLRSDIDGFCETALKDFMLDEAMPVLRLRSLLAYKDFETNLRAIEQWQQAETKRFLLHNVIAESTKAWLFNLEQNKLQANPPIWRKYKEPDYQYDLRPVQKEWFFRFHEHGRLALTSKTGEEEVKQLKKALNALQGVKTKHMAFRGARGNTLHNIAVGLLRIGEIEEALDYMKQHVQQQTEDGIRVTALGYNNYMVVLNCLGRLKESKQIYEEHRLLLENSAFANMARPMYCTACLYTGEIDKALKELPKLSNQLDHEKLTTRNLYLASFILRGEFELAQTEVQNLKRAIAGYEQNDYVKELQLVSYALMDFLVALKTGKNARRKMFGKTLHAANKAMKFLKDDPVQSVILNWIISKSAPHTAKLP